MGSDPHFFTVEVKVAGSVSNGGLTPFNFAHIAQSVEHFLGKEEVTGSNPVMGSI